MLERRGVGVITGTLVSEVTPDSVLLSTGDALRTRTAVWSAGISATELAGVSDLATSRSRRQPTDDRLRLAGRREVCAIGDLASVHVDGGELPMLSPPAMQEGRYAASAILARVRADAASRPFRYRDKGMMPAIGRNAAAQGLKTISTTIARISTSEP